MQLPVNCDVYTSTNWKLHNPCVCFGRFRFSFSHLAVCKQMMSLWYQVYYISIYQYITVYHSISVIPPVPKYHPHPPAGHEWWCGSVAWSSTSFGSQCCVCSNSSAAVAETTAWPKGELSCGPSLPIRPYSPRFTQISGRKGSNCHCSDPRCCFQSMSPLQSKALLWT